MITREQRLKEREMKRVLQEEELSKLEQSRQHLDNGSNRTSERNYEIEMRKRQEQLEQMRKEENWIFDCSVCGSHGSNYVSSLHYDL